MGAVWRARDLRTGDSVAAKVLARHDAGLLLRFVHEQSVRVRHPHVLAPTGWAAEDDVVVIVMDLVRGGSLHDLLADHGALPEDYVRVLLDQLLQGLMAVHAAGVVHRDLKPANLLLDATGNRVRACGSPTSASPPPPPSSGWPPRRDRSAPTATWRPSASTRRRPTRARTCTPPGGSPSSC